MALPSSAPMGRTTSFACQADQRFSYCLYVPKGWNEAPTATRVLVAMHDSLRDNQALRDRFSDYAEASNTLVVAPLFPAAIAVPDDVDNFKYLRFGDIRFDEIVLAMVEEVATRYRIAASTFSLFGFSGGAHFAHRMLYVHPSRLETVVAAAPGSVTLPNEDHAWWPGLRDFAQVFGHPVDWDAARKVTVHLIVGARDTDPNGIVRSKESPSWREGADAAGGNRVERLRSLHAQLLRKGVPATFEALEGVAHEAGPVVEAAIRFLRATQPRPAAAS
jgi:poly(3-hydroxybutyrate) depolymerase